MKNKENEQMTSDREVSSDNKENESVRECEKNNLDVPIDVSEIIDSLPEDKKSVIVKAICAIKQSSFRGPIPPPEILVGYEKTLPGASERIFKMVEEQHNHRMFIEKYIVNSQIRQSSRGQWIGATLAILFGALSGLLGYLGHDWLAGIIGVTTIIGLATIFVLNKSPESSNNKGEK